MNERKHLPDTRNSITKKLTISYVDPAVQGLSEIDIYTVVGLYEDGKPGELFFKAGKMGGTTSGLLDALGVVTSIGLQYGMPISEVINHFRNTRFEPSGPTNDPAIRQASSILDAVSKWLAVKFPEVDASAEVV